MFISCFCSIFCSLFYPVATLLVAYGVYKVVSRLKAKSNLKEVIRRKQVERANKLAQLEIEYRLNDSLEKILQLDDDQLIEQLQTRKLKAADVLTAFIAKAVKVTGELNCVTEFIPQAVEWATELDASEKIKGPLHGLPISIKDNCNIKGMDSTLGLGKRLYKPVQDHSVLVKVLLDLGAVPFCKTNVPQTLFSFNCGNPVFGNTKNFLNRALTPGGSSGGESCLISAGGSIFGIGTDIGGSVRIPAHFSGIVGFKSTKDRLSSRGFEASLPNIVGLVPVPGLLARNTKTLSKIFAHLVEDKRQQKYDVQALPIGFDHKILSSTSKLRIGYYTSFPFFPLIGDTEEVVLKAKTALEQEGHTLIPFPMPDSYEMAKLTMEFSIADSGAGFLRSWKHEPVSKGLYFNYLVCRAPVWLRRLLAFLLDGILSFQSPRAAFMLRGGAHTSGALFDRLGDRKKMIEKMTSQWRALDLDLLLCPTFPITAVHHELPSKLQACVAYTIIYNLFDMPCGVVPFGKESGTKVDAYDNQNDFLLRTAQNGMRQSTGMPISVQLVGLPYEDEKVLRGMEILENLAKKQNVK